MEIDDETKAAAREWLEYFRSDRSAILAELKWCGEPATIRRVLDQGARLDRAVLLSALLGCDTIMVKLGGLDAGDEEAARAFDEISTRFLLGLLGEGPPVDRATLRAELAAWAKGSGCREGRFLLKADDPNGVLRPFEGWPA